MCRWTPTPTKWTIMLFFKFSFIQAKGTSSALGVYNVKTWQNYSKTRAVISAIALFSNYFFYRLNTNCKLMLHSWPIGWCVCFTSVPANRTKSWCVLKIFTLWLLTITWLYPYSTYTAATPWTGDTSASVSYWISATISKVLWIPLNRYFFWAATVAMTNTTACSDDTTVPYSYYYFYNCLE